MSLNEEESNQLAEKIEEIQKINELKASGQLNDDLSSVVNKTERSTMRDGTNLGLPA